MSLAQNIQSVDANLETSNVKEYFNNFFIDFGTITANQNDALIGYFEKFTQGNKLAAAALASAVIFTAKAQGQDPMIVLGEFSRLPEGQLNAYLNMFLNLNRVGTSYLGINNQPAISKYVQRAILP